MSVEGPTVMTTAGVEAPTRFWAAAGTAPTTMPAPKPMKPARATLRLSRMNTTEGLYCGTKTTSGCAGWITMVCVGAGAVAVDVAADGVALDEPKQLVARVALVGPGQVAGAVGKIRAVAHQHVGHDAQAAATHQFSEIVVTRPATLLAAQRMRPAAHKVTVIDAPAMLERSHRMLRFQHRRDRAAERIDTADRGTGGSSAISREPEELVAGDDGEHPSGRGLHYHIVRLIPNR